jgi:hypothetical protein
VLAGWLAAYGVPRSLYVDKDSIYRCERRATVAQQIGGKEPQTQFGRAMEQLGVELILANSPQAKGRVERCNGLLQDRLVKALRLRGVSDLASANAFLENEFLAQINERFSLAAASPADVHQRVPRHLAEILTWEQERVVLRDWTFCDHGQWYQIDRRHEGLSLAAKKVLLRRQRDGTEQVLYRGQKLSWRKLPQRPKPRPPMPIKKPRQSSTPAAGHPWRQIGGAVGKTFWQQVKKQGRAQRRAQAAGLQSATASLRPPSIPPPQKEQQSRRGHSLLS